MHPNHVLWAAVALASLCPSPGKAEQRIVCPPEIRAHQISVAAPAGWRGLFRPGSKTSLSGAGVWMGPLEGGAPGELVGETLKGKNGTTINRFPALDLMPMDSGGVRRPQEKWMVCSYDAGVVLAMQLARDTKQCDVTYKRVQDPLEPRKKLIDVLSDITCR